MKRIFFHSWARYLISFIWGIIILVIYGVLNDSFGVYMTYVDGFFVGGFSLVCIGLLAVVNFFGGFTMLTYIFAKKPPKDTLYDYSERQKEKHSKNKFSFMPYFVVGIFFILVSVIMLLLR